MTRRETIDRLAARLTGLYDPREARSIARTLIAELAGLSLSALLTDPGAELTVEGLEEAAGRLAAGEPLQYVVGNTEFYGRRFAVRRGVLIPRPETEELVAWVLRDAQDARRLLDVGTGSGCIAASLALGLPEAEVFAADISETALAVAAENCRTLGARVTLRRADALAGTEADTPEGSTADALAGTGADNLAGTGAVNLAGTEADNLAGTGADMLGESRANAPGGSTADAPEENTAYAQDGDDADSPAGLEKVFGGGFDAIVSNPPYVPAGDRAAMHPNVRDHEPAEALFVPNDDAIRFYRAIARAGRRMLRPGGRLWFEIYERAADEIVRMLGDEGYTETVVREDLFGKPRMLCSRKR